MKDHPEFALVLHCLSRSSRCDWFKVILLVVVLNPQLKITRNVVKCARVTECKSVVTKGPDSIHVVV